MSKLQKRIKSNWAIGAHTVNSYKRRVPDPAVKRKNRSAKDIRRVISQALNKVKDDGKSIYLTAKTFRGNPKPKTLYRVNLFKEDYYILCIGQQVVTLFSHDMIENDAKTGSLIFRDDMPFNELQSFYIN